MNHNQVRADIVTRRTYCRPTNDEETEFETWEGGVTERVGNHQRWLWETAQGHALTPEQEAELEELKDNIRARYTSLAGRTNWLGGTELAKRRASSNFNCSFLEVTTVHDVVDIFWLLLQGCGTGFKAKHGTLSGFSKPAKITVIRSERTVDDYHNGFRGRETNQERIVKKKGKSKYVLSIGDSAQAWAKSVGKLLALKEPVDEIVLDFREIRAGGVRLKGYGWISSGDETFSKALTAICGILNARSGELLSKMDIHDTINWLGTTLSSRRSAEISVMDFGDPEWEEFALCKKEHFIDNPQRAQSNNSTLFYRKPSRLELRALFHIMEEGGGSEPAIINAVEARRRAPWFSGVNPCGEILLSGSGSFCCLVETNAEAYNGDFEALKRAHWLNARANYRQTCVDLRDEVLQASWHEQNQFLHLCGVGVTGIVAWDGWSDRTKWRELRSVAHAGAHSMADELGLPRSKAITTVKPSGSLSKIMSTTEGVHKPLGKYIFNNINLSVHDPLVALLQNAGYHTFPNPYDSTGMLVRLPVSYENVEFDRVEKPDGGILEVNLESAVDQLERYKLLMEEYVDHNCSITVSYSPEEVPEIIDWLDENWDSYVGVSFIYRNDPTKTAADLGYPYLPQEVVTKERFDEYTATLSPVDFGDAGSTLELEEDECAGGACPVR